jgi:hypothetical protein
MPFKSKQQEKWMWATHPKMARQWEEHTPKDKTLPDKLKARSKKKDK